jgi:hypothetical protein
MSDLERKRRDLVKAEQDIADGDRRVSEQIERIERLRGRS